MPHDDSGRPENGPATVPDGSDATTDATTDALPAPQVVDGGSAPDPDAEPVADAAAAAAEEPAPVIPGETAIAARLADIEASLTALTRRHDDDAERAAARERVIERQHADIERLRTDERFGLLQPVLVDLCALRNDLLRQASTLPPDLSVARMVDLLESFAASVEDTLLRCGVEPQPREVGTPFAPRRQRVARVVEVADPERDGTVAEIVQDGYAEVDGGRVVLPTRVAVHRAVAAPPQNTDATDAMKEHVDA
jgi:molecular chaperone GrpE